MRVPYHVHQQLGEWLFRILSPADGDLLTWNGISRLWRNQAGAAIGVPPTFGKATAGTHITTTGPAGMAGMAFYGGENMALVGADLTERSTAAVGNDAATLSAVTGMVIPQGTPIFGTFRFRKTAGSANYAFIGIQVNGTQVWSTAKQAFLCSNNNQAEDGMAWFYFFPGETNYQTSMIGASISQGAGGLQTGTLASNVGPTNPIPIATVTSFTLTGNAVNAAQTLSTRDLKIYTLA